MSVPTSAGCCVVTGGKSDTADCEGPVQSDPKTCVRTVAAVVPSRPEPHLVDVQLATCGQTIGA